MTTSISIRSHIDKLQYGAMFTTRQLLTYGTRKAVDHCIARLLKVEYMQRLARGVFVKLQCGEKPKESPFEVAEFKAAAFGKRILAASGDILQKLKC